VTTHELAKALTVLTRILKEGPDVDVRDFRPGQAASGMKSADIAVNLATLLELSRLGKGQWESFIKEHGMPLHTRPRDASRDLLGKVLRFLEEKPEFQERIRREAAKRNANASPELTRALSWLLPDEKS
jgi:hypothetical protein